VDRLVKKKRPWAIGEEKVTSKRPRWRMWSRVTCSVKDALRGRSSDSFTKPNLFPATGPLPLIKLFLKLQAGRVPSRLSKTLLYRIFWPPLLPSTALLFDLDSARRSCVHVHEHNYSHGSSL
jgi:hypothetical protein